MKKKVAVIGTVGLPANYGGFETLTEHLVTQLGDQTDITVYCSGKRYPKQDRRTHYKGSKLTYLPLEANGVQSIPYDSLSILHALFFADVLLILGVAGAWLLPFVRLFTRKKIIISIDGIEWKRDKWSWPAKFYLFWAEQLAVKFSHIDISDNESIQDYTALRYGSLSHVIEYGADHTLKVPVTEKDVLKYPFLLNPYAFKVCRIEPENNIELILQVFTQFREYPLVLVGNWDKSEFGQNIRKRYAKEPNIVLLDPIYEQRAIDLLRGNAHVYLHGHSAGGTNPSLVEAMYLGLPIIAYAVSYNKTTTEHRAKYFSTSEELLEQLLNTTPEDLAEIGLQMQSIADRRYRWAYIANKYQHLFEKVLERKEKPQVVPTIKTLKPDLLRTYGAAHLHHQKLFFQS